MPEDHDYSPAPWATHDTFTSARAAFDKNAGRAYADAVSKALPASDLIPDTLKSNSENPIVILCDVTGSMGEWPATIFSKLPYLDHETKFYFGDDYEISFGAIGDAYSDKYPLQIKEFATGKGLEKELKGLIVEGGGGGGGEESYDLGALYYARNVEIPKAIKPVLILIGDEGVYVNTPKDIAEKIKVNISKQISIAQIIKELQQKWDVYIIRKPYGSGTDSSPDSDNSRIQRQWDNLLGEDHVVLLPEAARVVDVIFGIFAKVTGKDEEFEKELKDRQLKDKGGKDKVNMVLKSLKTIRAGSTDPDNDFLPKKSLKKLPPGASVTRRRKGSDDDGENSVSLI